MISATDSATSTQSSTTSGKPIMGKDDFMKLMIAQLKNQDPLNPMDGSQYAAQLAQFSSVEQLMNLNDKMETSVNANYSLTQSINNTMTAALIGKEVKMQGGEVNFNSEDSIQLGYNLPAGAASASISVYDGNGVLVKTIDGIDKLAGDHKVTWDFKDNNGNTVPVGTYTFKVDAKNAKGNDITADVFKYGVIAGIRFTANGTKLVIGKSEYSMSDVSEIVNPK